MCIVLPTDTTIALRDYECDINVVLDGKSGTGIRYPADLYMYISPQTVPHITRYFRQSGCTVKLIAKRMRAKEGGSMYNFYRGFWYDPAGTRTHDVPRERRIR